ncbi:AAA family ATPase [Shewanella sp. SM74]|uniref:AAA family ATPase n=3 Tax=unclassified Shewanella TaxID=196818 RepID=UPI0021DB763F|nr:AAA family ATPase [Shewanella sp. SM74]MCU8013151.1 AAA family ATPase [Shewanella sp. SM74]
MTLNKTISSIELQNFKGYRYNQGQKNNRFDFDNADLILITGKNGVGKTSLLEALDWTMNQDGIPNKYLNQDEKTGLVVVNGNKFDIGEKNHGGDFLKTVSTFFFQEHIKELACNEVIQLLEPDNKPAHAMKASLKSLQIELEKLQQQLQQSKYRKDYETERKKFAGIITEKTESLNNDNPIKALLKSSTLTINNGNLQSKWDSQIRNLSKGLSELTSNNQVIGESIPEYLAHIEKCLRDVEFKIMADKPEQEKKPEFDPALFDRLEQLPAELEVKWFDGSKGNNLSPSSLDLLIVDVDENKYLLEIKKLLPEQEELRIEYQKVSDAIRKLIDSDSLENWLNSFHENIDQWLSAFDNDAESVSLAKIIEDLTDNLDKLKVMSQKKLKELYQQRINIEVQGKRISSEIQRLNLYSTAADQFNRFKFELKEKFQETTFTVGEALSYAKNKLAKLPKAQFENNDIYSLKILIGTFRDWSSIEYEKQVDEKNISQPESIENAETLLSSAIKICKQESGINSQLLNLMSEIPAVELQSLTENMNSLLDKFHFPKGFLPIKLSNTGTDKKPAWTFETQNEVKFSDLSTGQKTQLAICWTINLNLALADTLNHQVIGFDDFTTSLDMNQLIPAAVLLRKMAYANDGDKWKRQVIVTSHHEDLTNRLLDFLLPPQGRSMRVIQFEDWSPKTGPSFNCFKVEMGEQTSSISRAESAIKRLFSN